MWFVLWYYKIKAHIRISFGHFWQLLSEIWDHFWGLLWPKIQYILWLPVDVLLTHDNLNMVQQLSKFGIFCPKELLRLMAPLNPLNALQDKVVLPASWTWPNPWLPHLESKRSSHSQSQGPSLVFPWLWVKCHTLCWCSPKVEPIMLPDIQESETQNLRVLRKAYPYFISFL